MKIIVSLLLIFTVLTDFASASMHDDLNTCETKISCTDVDFHSSSESHDSDDEHDHCHLGHSHNVIISTSFAEINLSTFDITNPYPDYRVDQPTSYHLDIIRPPIS